MKPVKRKLSLCKNSLKIPLTSRPLAEKSAINASNVSNVIKKIMEIGNKRHGKKSDKETQSPVIKVFKEMIQREYNDPEKANLLKEKQENRKRKQYSGSRSKLDRTNRSRDSSSSEKNRRSVQYKVAVQGQETNECFNQRSPSIPFEGDKKDSWWFWGETQNKQSEDTCSCVSCALKKIVSSEYTCIACLGVLFLLSVLVAFMVLFRTVPVSLKSASAQPTAKKPREVGSELLKRKIDLIERGAKDDDNRPLWDDTRTRHLSSLSGLHGNDFDDASYRELNALENSGRSDSELSGILDAEKLNDGLSSERLRDFYKKLIKTDAQIRNLKKNVNEIQTNYDELKLNYPDRSKRSLRAQRLFHQYDKKKEAKTQTPVLTENNLAEIKKFNLFYPPYSAVKISNKNKKSKRFANGTEEPMGFLIEKKQILVQYKPQDGRKVPKCSHAPKESKSHEKQMKHPFYKNTQRLDELLDQFLDKKLPEMMVDPFGVDILFNKKIEGTKAHKTNVKIEKINKRPLPKTKSKDGKEIEKDNKIFEPWAGSNRFGELDRKYFDMVPSKMEGKYTTPSTTSDYDVLLSVSTIVSPGHAKVTKTMNTAGHTLSLLERVPHLRKLLQVDQEDEEGLGYEDLKEVLADDNEAHDETDKVQDRKKRTDDNKIDDLKIPNNPYKYNPPGVHNPNWKGPMPLYPDELSSMIKQAAIENVENKIQIPVNTKDMSSEAVNLETDLDDMEYIENYSDNKFRKLAKMAQAYSDYGVLEGKTEARNEKEVDGKNTERRVKLSVSKARLFKNALFDRFKKSKVSEGIRFEYRPTTLSRGDKPASGGDNPAPGLKKRLEKHFKVMNCNCSRNYHPFISTKDTQKRQNADFSDTSSKKIVQNEDPHNADVFAFAKNGRRSLKSVEELDINDDNLDNATSKESDLLIKVLSNIDVKNIDGGNTSERAEMVNDSHHHFHHHSQHHHHNKSNIKSNEDSNEFGGRVLAIVNETANINSENTSISNNASSNKVDRAAVPDNNLLSTILNLNAPKDSSEMALSDFFMLMSNWFSVMAGFDTSSESSELKSNIIKLITKSESPSTTPKNNDTYNIEFPMYDSDMIENIGHRSRVLMSVDDSNKSTDIVDASEKSTGALKEKADEITSASSAVSKEDVSIQSAVTSSTTTVVIDKTTPTNTGENLPLAKDERSVDNKTVFKRNVPDDSSLIFWNDIYDDEYGVKLDPLDDTIAEKRNSRGENFVRRSGNWIQDKMKNFANNFRGKEKNIIDKNIKRRVLRNAYLRQDPRNIYKRHAKRDANYKEVDNDETTGFAELTVKMKAICKEAANAVKQTRNIQVRQNEKEDTMATTLMQQLVRLMTDLVDFQVQQKTCAKLPPDLQEFLVWLTSPNSDQVDLRDQKISYNEAEGSSFVPEKPSDQLIDLVTTPSSEREDVHSDGRSECLGTLHAVQDLMQQYDEMTDEDKSKMTGIRDYLENQLQFLHKQLASFGDYKVSEMFEDDNPSYRFRRDLPSAKKHRSNQVKLKMNFKNRFRRRFLKNYGKKHTRSTVSIYDGFGNTEVYKFTKDSKKDISENFNKRENNNVKRNIKDVYYKALNDAKKSTTFKVTLKDELDGFDHAQIVRIDN